MKYHIRLLGSHTPTQNNNKKLFLERKVLYPFYKNIRNTSRSYFVPNVWNLAQSRMRHLRLFTTVYGKFCPR